MEPLASLDDYAARHGVPDDPRVIYTRLASASSLVRRAAGQTISLVEADIVTLNGTGDRRILLPEIPVLEVRLVTLDAVVLVEGTDYRWWTHGRLERRRGCWPAEPRNIVVTYDHGDEIVDAWLVDLVCGMVHRASQTWAATGIRSEQLGDHQVAYQVSSAGAMIWLDEPEAARMEVYGGPTFA